VRASLAFIAAALLLAAAPRAGAQELGTLFFTPQERAQLERQRRGESAEQASAVRRDPVLTGYVKRSDGKSTVFLDNRPYPVRSGSLQKALSPKIVERYEPPPEPEAPVAEPAEAASSVPAAPAKAGTPAPRKGAGDE
jgi:hypothetical protein